MLPNSVTVGEKSISNAIVAALINFIVIIGVRNTAIFASAATASKSDARWKPRDTTRHGILRWHNSRNLFTRMLEGKLFRYECSAAPRTCTRFSAKYV